MFLRMFHLTGLAHFTHTVSSLKMMDISSLFLPIAFALLIKKQAQNPKPRQICDYPYKTSCVYVHNFLKSAFFCRSRQKKRSSFKELFVRCKM
jgi:hypothetical protein